MAKPELFGILNCSQGRACKVYIKFSVEQAGSKTSYLVRQISLVPIQKCELEISIMKGSASPSTKRVQFQLILAWTSVHKVQGLSLEKGVIGFDLQKQKFC